MKKRIIICCVMIFILITIISMTGCVINASPYAGITDAKINENGELVVTYSDGTIQNIGKVTGEDGKDGLDGKDGADGKDGIDGKDGVNGKDGIDGKDGQDSIGGGSTTVNPEYEGVAKAISTGLRSSVSIVAKFTERAFPYEEYGSAGAGVIYKLDEDGNAYIITNYHVVFDKDSRTGISQSITVYAYGKEWAEYGITAEYVGGSQTYDIAVLRIRESEFLKNSGLSAITAADSDKIAVGESAIAIGNPDSMGISASVGIISVDSEYITMTAADGSSEVSFRVMRIDTAVNPGNSGGGLFNSSGELIGIVNAKTSDTTLENIGYAIPSNIATRVAESIIYYCNESDAVTIKKPLMGIMVIMDDSSTVYDEETSRIYIHEKVRVDEVSAGSAAEGKLQVDDIFKTAYLGDLEVEITRQYQIIDLMLLVRAGDTLSYDVIRDGEIVRVDIPIPEEALTNVS